MMFKYAKAEMPTPLSQLFTANNQCHQEIILKYRSGINTFIKLLGDVLGSLKLQIYVGAFKGHYSALSSTDLIYTMTVWTDDNGRDV